MRRLRFLELGLVVASLLLVSVGGAAAQTRMSPPNTASLLVLHNEAFANKVFLPVTTQVTSLDISAFTIESEEPEHDCYPGGTPDTGTNSAWVSFAVPAGGKVVISTAGSTATTVMTLHRGFTVDDSNFDFLTDEVACSATGSLTTTPGLGMYHLQVSKSGGADLLNLSIDYTPPAGSSRPSNDDMANAKPITLGKSYRQTKVEYATNEPIEPSTTCGSQYPTSTIWYTFTIPEGFYGEVNFAAFGSHTVQMDSYDPDDVILTLYDFEFDVLSCSDDFATPGASAILTEEFHGPSDEGVHYLAIGAYTAVNLVGPSWYKLQTNVMALQDYPLVDVDFENADPAWKFSKALNGDAVVDEPAFAYSGNHYAKFFGGANEATKLSQSAAWPAVMIAQKGAHIAFDAFYSSTTENGKLKITLTVKYASGASSSASYTIAGKSESASATSGNYVLTPYVSVLLTDKFVSSVKVVFKHKSPDGIVRLDDVELLYLSATLRDAPLGVLPLPIAP